MYLAYNNADLDAIHDAEPTDREQEAIMTWTDRDDYEQSLADHHTLIEQQPAQLVTCQHCGRHIEWHHIDGWVDPEATTGDDDIWRVSCDAHDTFTAEHEPECDRCNDRPGDTLCVWHEPAPEPEAVNDNPGTPFPAPLEW